MQGSSLIFSGLNHSLQYMAKIAILIAALLVSLSLLIWAARGATGEVFKARAVSELYTMNQLSNRYHGIALLARARGLNPYDAELPFYQAQFLCCQNKVAHEQARPDEKTIQSTYSFYRQALAMRPHSGHLWAQYARAQFEYSNEIQVTLLTLEKALRFAPYQRAVIVAAIQIGLPHWGHLNNSQKLKLRKAIDFLLDKNAALVINAAVENNLAEQLRPLLKQPKHIQRLKRALMKKVLHR